MSGFLDRVVTLALGTAAVAHRRHEPILASPARSRPESDEFGSVAEDVGVERPGARRSRAHRIAGYDAAEADRADVDERSGARGLPGARSRARDDASAAGEADRGDAEGRVLDGDAEAETGDMGSFSGVTARDTSRLGSDAAAGPGRLNGPRVFGAFDPRDRFDSADASSAPYRPPAPDERIEGPFRREERSLRGDAPSQGVIGRDSGIDGAISRTRPAAAQALGRAAERGSVDAGGDAAIESNGAESGIAPDREGRRRRRSAIGTAEEDASGEALHVSRPSRSLADPDRAGRAIEDDVTINVSIGRIDVVRPAPPPASPQPVAAGPARPTLDDYLRLRAKVRGR